MSRVISDIDGFNLYFGLKSKGWKRYYWLDLEALSTALLLPGQTLLETKYFTARLRRIGHNQADAQRQNDYLDALATRRTLRLHFGHDLQKTRQCRSCGSTWPDYEEKMTDVNIAVQLLADAFDNRFDTAQLPPSITTPAGLTLQRPTTWS